MSQLADPKTAQALVSAVKLLNCSLCVKGSSTAKKFAKPKYIWPGSNWLLPTAAFVSVPDEYLQSLKVGGRMIAVVGESEPMSINVIRRVTEREWQTETMFETVIPVMINAEPKAEFEF